MFILKQVLFLFFYYHDIIIKISFKKQLLGFCLYL